MPIALVAHLKGSSTNSNGFTTTSIDTTGANLLVVVLVDHGGNASFADSKANTWLTAISPQSSAPGSNPYIRTIYAKNPTVGTGHTFTVTSTFGQPFVAVAAFSGCDTAAPLDQTSFATGAFNNTLQAGSITPGVAGEVVVAGSLARATGTLTVDSSYILVDTGAYVPSNAYGGGLAYIVQSAAAATNPTWTLSGGLAGAQIASFKSGTAPPIPITVSTTQAQAVSLARAATFRRTVATTQAQAVTLTRASLVARTVAATQAQALGLVKSVALTRAITQAQAASGSFGRVSVRVVAATQATTALLARRAVSLTRALQQPQVVGLRGAAARGLTIPQPTQVRLTARVIRTLTATQAQTASLVLGRGYQRTVTAVQTQAVRLLKGVQLVRAMTGSHRIQTSVSLRRVVGRLLRATQPTTARVVKQVRLTRALAQPQTVSFSGLPVQLRVVSTVQTRSLALGRNVFLTRLIAQAQALVLVRATSLERTAVQPTLATLERAVSRVLALSVSTTATLEWRNVTPRYDVLVTARVSQQVSLSTAGAGKTARQFIVDTRRADFVVGQRSSSFAVRGRGVRFTVEER